MSITLMAYPMAFLISPKEAPKENLKIATAEVSTNNTVASKNLKFIKVLTNITFDEINELMNAIDCEKTGELAYKINNDLTIKWEISGKYIIGYIFGQNPKELQENGETFFQDLDKIAGRNIRLIDSSEFFYYIYSTEYKKENEIYSALKKEGATQIYTTSDGAVVGNVKGQIIKYYKRNDLTYLLEVEQKITILNIGVHGKVEGRNITYGLTDLKIQTNIKPEELKILLHKANYLYYPENSQTPLKNSNSILNWILKDGYYTAEFSGANNAAIVKEAEILFRKLNTAAARDLRLINDEATTIYTYKTNYTDKGVLINTLTEHGAEEITENGDEISCKLFDMEMIYYKKGNSNGYTLDITHITNKSECEELMQDLNEEYGLNIQEITYNKIKERLAQENLRLENEEILDDESIVLTIEV
jgi:hypothetical protein